MLPSDKELLFYLSSTAATSLLSEQPVLASLITTDETIFQQRLNVGALLLMGDEVDFGLLSAVILTLDEQLPQIVAAGWMRAYVVTKKMHDQVIDLATYTSTQESEYKKGLTIIEAMLHNIRSACLFIADPNVSTGLEQQVDRKVRAAMKRVQALGKQFFETDFVAPVDESMILATFNLMLKLQQETSQNFQQVGLLVKDKD